MIKVRYVGPGRSSGTFRTEDLTIGKEYEIASFENQGHSLVYLEDDAGDMIIGVIKGREECPFEEYFELVTE